MKYCMIVNPASGRRKGRKIMQKVIDRFAENDILIEPHISSFKGHPYTLAKETDLKDCHGLLVIGGDGTFHEVLNGMMDRPDGLKIPLGIIPGGTGNSLVHDLGTLNPQKAVDLILKNNIVNVDIARLDIPSGHLYSFNIVGWGLPETINGLAEKWRNLGSRRYDLASLAQIIKNPDWEVKIILDDKVLEGRYSFFLACNTKYSGNGMKVAPKAIHDDGLFDVLILKREPRWKLVRMFTRIFKGNHIKDPILQYHQVRSFEIHPKEDTILNVDGQLTGCTPVKVQVLPKAIQLFK